jgi:hypothetical protein
MTEAFDPYRIAYAGSTLKPPSYGGGGGGGTLPAALNLPDFIDHVRWLLDKITGDWCILLVPRDRRNIMRGAFEDLDTRNVFEDVKTELVSTSKNQALTHAGLEGKQAEMKLSKFRDLWSRFMSGGLGWLDRILRFINKLLKSIASAVPGAEAIVELKDQCEEEIADVA